MSVKLAINGFGRTGRCAFRIAFDRSDVDIVAISSPGDKETLAYLLQYDTSYGVYKYEVKTDEDGLVVNGRHIKVVPAGDLAELPWGELGVDVVIESSGRFTDPAVARAHVEASGAKAVVIAAPAKGDGASTVVLGVNDKAAEAGGGVFSAASCTTNCITPVAAIIEENFGIDSAMMTTVHSYTNSQVLQDSTAKDLRDGRAAAENLIPTTTGASVAAALALPALKGIFGGLSVRVPLATVSLSDLTFITKKPVTVEAVNACFKKAVQSPRYKGIVGVSEGQLVSSDFKGDSRSAIIDLPLTAVVGRLLKVVAWYDNEWGYSTRLVELAVKVGK